MHLPNHTAAHPPVEVLCGAVHHHIKAHLNWPQVDWRSECGVYDGRQVVALCKCDQGWECRHINQRVAYGLHIDDLWGASDGEIVVMVSCAC